MNILIVVAVILAGSILESAFSWMLTRRPAPRIDPEENRYMDERYARLTSDFEAA